MTQVTAALMLLRSVSKLLRSVSKAGKGIRELELPLQIALDLLLCLILREMLQGISFMFLTDLGWLRSGLRFQVRREGDLSLFDNWKSSLFPFHACSAT